MVELTKGEEVRIFDANSAKAALRSGWCEVTSVEVKEVKKPKKKLFKKASE